MKLEAILLAAGNGRRFGGGKLTAAFDGRPLIARSLQIALQAPVDEVVLVTGFHAAEVETCVREIEPSALARGRLRIVRAANADYGMGASLAAGVAALGSVDGVFVFLGDMPMTPPSMARLLAERLAEEVDAVAPVWRAQRGHPVLFGRALLPALSRLEADEGARSILSNLGTRLALVDAPGDGVLLDVDTADDLHDLASLSRTSRVRDQVE